MKKLIILILFLFSANCFAQDTIKTFYKIYNFGEQDREVYKCFVIQSNNGIDTVCVKVPSTFVTTFKFHNYGIPNKQVYKYSLIQNSSEQSDTVCVKVPSAQAQRDSSNFDTTMTNLKSKIEADYKADIKAFQELQTKILKEESYLEILNYLIEERKK